MRLPRKDEEEEEGEMPLLLAPLSLLARGPDLGVSLSRSVGHSSTSLSPVCFFGRVGKSGVVWRSRGGVEPASERARGKESLGGGEGGTSKEFAERVEGRRISSAPRRMIPDGPPMAASSSIHGGAHATAGSESSEREGFFFAFAARGKKRTAEHALRRAQHRSPGDEDPRMPGRRRRGAERAPVQQHAAILCVLCVCVSGLEGGSLLLLLFVVFVWSVARAQRRGGDGRGEVGLGVL